MKKLKTRIADPNSRLWRNKADAAWAKVIHTQGVCAVCGATKPQVQLQAHHLIPREVLHFRHDPNNGVLLCTRHHKYGLALSAHKNTVAFLIWFRDAYPERWAWLEKSIAGLQYPSPEGSYNFKNAWRICMLRLPPD